MVPRNIKIMSPIVESFIYRSTQRFILYASTNKHQYTQVIQINDGVEVL